MDTITFHIPRPAAQLLVQVLKIASKAHGNTPSPVDIKLELAELDKEMLDQLSTEIGDLL